MKSEEERRRGKRSNIVLIRKERQTRIRGGVFLREKRRGGERTRISAHEKEKEGEFSYGREKKRCAGIAAREECLIIFST